MKLETTLKEHVKQNDMQFRQNEKDHREVLDRLESLRQDIKNLSKIYASKVVEKIVYGILGAIGFAVLGKILGLINL